MAKPDDSSLEHHELLAVEAKAIALLHKADAWDRFPTPVDDILEAAKLRVAPSGMRDAANFLAFVAQKTAAAGKLLKSALSKVLGLYDANEHIIHIDESVVASKQTFLKLHETGHHEIPAHRDTFKIFQDCELTLAPTIADLFEREANNFARYALFQGDTYKLKAADMACAIKTPMALAKHFGASIYASSREYVRTHHRACVLFALEQPVQLPAGRSTTPVRRIEVSQTFKQQFGIPNDQFIDFAHRLGALVPPPGRRMTAPSIVLLRDLNGVEHECIGEAFNSTFNIFLLIFPKKALTATSIVMPPWHI
ncbi:ImmA/IrrE family metallo-endopeptidase [Pseudomonas jessenii]|uniref:Uncharacterized protein DUF955 n=1 Tax=Pseudomonas jessenii TaxID=77298 RepID=A0A370S8Y6_PSEJE|nr:ImmA/IrrE family metallo-endopeptidase [Pseudomonas jessenii]RDL16229.1 uncharacterized protein DUF955 [Pseudomonas jessenii]